MVFGEVYLPRKVSNKMLTNLFLFLMIGFFWGFLITWLFYDEDKPLGVIILNSKKEEVCTYSEKK